MAPCTTSKDHRKIIEGPIWTQHEEEVSVITDMKQFYASLKKETIERVFADAYFCYHEFDVEAS